MALFRVLLVLHDERLLNLILSLNTETDYQQRNIHKQPSDFMIINHIPFSTVIGICALVLIVYFLSCTYLNLKFKVLHGGAAYKDGRLQVNDQLIGIEDIDLQSCESNSEASDAITKCLKEIGEILVLTRGSKNCFQYLDCLFTMLMKSFPVAVF